MKNARIVILYYKLSFLILFLLLKSALLLATEDVIYNLKFKQLSAPYSLPTNEVQKVYQDKDGFIFLTGRQKDMIVLKNGKKVFPEELETLINRLDLVKECIVYGMPDEKDKNDLKLSVKIVYDKKIAEEKYSGKSEGELYQILWEKVKEINKTFPPYKYIKNMILTDEELIKTTTQKVKRNEEIKRILGR